MIEGFEIRIEDRGSSNGTFLNSADRRVTGPTTITEADTIYFGTLDDSRRSTSGRPSVNARRRRRRSLLPRAVAEPHSRARPPQTARRLPSGRDIAGSWSGWRKRQYSRF